MWCLSLLLLVLSSCSVEAYRAGVVHYYPTPRTTPRKAILRNVKEYARFAAKARRKDVDILVFPEYGLVSTNGLAAPRYYSIEVGNNTICNKLSDIARENHLYLVVNLFEKIQDKIYNANLVFDRNGTLILKYHKIHLFNEDALTPGSLNQTLTFQTDFGVTFGIFTCFDIFFLNPSITVLQGTNVTDIVFVTGWLPSYISLSIEQGYSVASKVNLLAANYGRSYAGRSGTGIFLKDGKRSKIVVDSPRSVLLVKEVPQEMNEANKQCSKNRSRNLENVTTKDKYIFRAIDLKQRNIRTKICNRNFCCIFDITIQKANNSDIYKLMIFDDSVHYPTLRSDFHICTLLACQNDSISSCGAMTEVATIFQKLSVTGYFTKDNSTFHRPITLSTALSPLKHVAYCDSGSIVQLQSKNQKDLLVFGIFERRDSVVEEESDFPNFQDFIMLFWGRPHFYPLFTTT